LFPGSTCRHLRLSNIGASTCSLTLDPSIIDLVCKHYFADRSATDSNFVFVPVIPGGNNRQCFIPEVQRQVANFSLALSVLTGSLSSLSAPKLGSLSDRYGRKRMMVVCSIGGIVSEIITILAAKFPDVVSFRWLLLGAFFDGLTGSFTAGSVLSHAYTSDCTPPSKRGVAIGYLHSCLFTGLAVGPLIAGYLVEWTGSLISIFYILLGCHIFYVAFLTLITPESLSKRRQLAARGKHKLALEALAEASPELDRDPARPRSIGGHIRRLVRTVKASNPLAPLAILFPSGNGPNTARLRRNLLVLGFVDVVLLGAAVSAGGIIILYVEYMFEWGNFESSRFISMISMVRVLVLVAILPALNYLFRKRPAAARRRQQRLQGLEPPADSTKEQNRGADEVDIWILRFALLAEVVGSVGYVLARTGAQFVGCAVITGFGGLGSATLQAALSKHVPQERVGQLLGAIGLLHSLARVAAPTVFNKLYAATVESYPQAFFVLLVGLFGAALIASFALRPHGE
jgi:MFS family permease